MDFKLILCKIGLHQWKITYRFGFGRYVRFCKRLSCNKFIKLEKIKMTENIYTIEYNPKQKQFHIDILKNTIRSNIDSVLDKKCLHWIFIGIAESNDEAIKYIESFKEKQK